MGALRHGSGCGSEEVVIACQPSHEKQIHVFEALSNCRSRTVRALDPLFFIRLVDGAWGHLGQKSLQISVLYIACPTCGVIHTAFSRSSAHGIGGISDEGTVELLASKSDCTHFTLKTVSSFLEAFAPYAVSGESLKPPPKACPDFPHHPASSFQRKDYCLRAPHIEENKTQQNGEQQHPTKTVKHRACSCYWNSSFVGGSQEWSLACLELAEGTGESFQKPCELVLLVSPFL
ncbi:hypothetical protein TURU_022679 [Turdus rufiventris]|nr:hypothetical protein TURU_022679 [Turdus rufiventris]